MWGPIIRLRRWSAPRPHAGFVITLAALDDTVAEIEIDVGLRTGDPVAARDRAQHLTETLMPELTVIPVAMRQADERDLTSEASVAPLGPIRHPGLCYTGTSPP